MRGVPQRSIKRDQQKRIRVSAFTCRRMFPRTGPFDGERNGTASTACLHTTLSGDCELAFLGDPFEGLGRAFDAILTIVTVDRKQAEHLVGAAGGRSGNVAGSKIDSLSNGVLVLQRPLHTQSDRQRQLSRERRPTF